MPKVIQRVRTMAVSVAVVMAAAGCGDGGGEVTTRRADDAAGAPSATSDGGTARDTGATDNTGDTGAAVLDGGVITDDAIADILIDGSFDAGIDTARLDALLSTVLALDAPARDAALADLAARVDAAAAPLFGLTEPTDAAWAAETAALVTQVTDLAMPTAPAVTGFRRGPEPPSAVGTTAGALFAAYMAVALAGPAAIEAGNTIPPGQSATNPDGTVSSSTERSTLEIDVGGSQDGADMMVKVTMDALPCPDASGRAHVDAHVEVTTMRGATGGSATMDLGLDVDADDHADLAGTSLTNRVQWAEHTGTTGQFLDVTMTRGESGFQVTANRSGGTVTDGFVAMAVVGGTLFGEIIAHFLQAAVVKAWQSGRCVKVDVSAAPGPSGLEPSSTSTITAIPISTIDGASTGGTVTATLTGGGASVDPSGTPVAADDSADFTFTAPSERDQTGTVSVEARSLRGVGRASITLDTKAPAAYQIVGGAGDFQTDTLVCDIMAPFTLSGGGFTVNFSGGLAGSYSYTGPMGASGGAAYSITLPDGLGQPGIMDGWGEGSVQGSSAYGTEHYTLTPAAPCTG